MSKKKITKVREEKLEKSLIKIAELRYYMECLRWNKEDKKLLDKIGTQMRKELGRETEFDSEGEDK
jgi:hypothetical protein